MIKKKRSRSNFYTYEIRYYIFMYIKNERVKPVLSGHSKIDKTKVLKTNGSLMKVKSIAECSLGAFCNTFGLHKAIISLENLFRSFLEWLFYTDFTGYMYIMINMVSHFIFNSPVTVTTCHRSCQLHLMIKIQVSLGKVRNDTNEINMNDKEKHLKPSY